MGNIAPDVDCPVCGQRFAKLDYAEMSEGSEMTCPSCNAELAVSEVEMVMCWRICTKQKYEEAQAKEEAYRQEQRETFLRRHRRSDG